MGSALFILSLDAIGQVFVDSASVHELTTGPNGSFWGNGVSFYDINGDGMDDITLYRDSEYLRYYLSTDSGFVEIVTDVFLGSGAVHMLWVDYNDDGAIDIALSHYDGQIYLYENDGDFNFSDVTIEAGLTTEIAQNFGLSFADYDLDGDLDLYVCRYYGPFQTNPKENILYKNNGDGTFTDVTDELNVGDGYKHSFMAIWLDINNDLYPDLYIINDRVPGNTLFKNNGDGTFTDITETAGVSFPNNDPMSITVSDFDNDGDLDMFVTNSGTMAGMPVLLLVNQGDDTFDEMAHEMNVGHQTVTWGSVWIDYNNNGWRDLFFVTGELLQNSLFINFGGVFFENAQPFLNNIPISRSYACAAGDYNNDGYTDIIINNLPPHQPQFLVNQGGENHYIKFCLKGTLSNKQAIGSWIHVYRGLEHYHDYTLCGENYIGQDSQNIIFGLGNDATDVDSVVVHYPSGHVEVYYDLEVDQLHILTEGETYQVEISSTNGTIFCPGSSTVLDAGLHAAYLWSTGDTVQHIQVTNPGNYEVSVFNDLGIVASTEIDIEMYPAPLISAFTLEPLCNGEASGSIALSNDAAVATDQVLWANGTTGAELDSLAAGQYPYTFTDTNGCSVEGEVTLNEPTELVLLIQVNPEIEGGDASIYTAVFGGTAPYNITLNGDSIGNYTTGLSGGNYNLVIFDQNNCSVGTEVAISSSLNEVNTEMKHLRLFPNPTRDFIQVEYPSPIVTIKLIDVQGKIIWENGPTGISRFDIQHLGPGVYLCAIEFQDGKHHVERVIKER